jgi:ACR3 family arsenite efflux pump ArsB
MLSYLLYQEKKRKMISWIVIGMLIIILLVFAKIKHIRHKTFLIAVVLILLFFYISAVSVIGNKNLNLTSFSGITEAGKLYFTWLVHIGGNTQHLVANAIKMDWVGNVTK